MNNIQSFFKKIIKMISLNSICNLILIHLIASVQSQSSPGDVLGPSACDIYGVQQDSCKIPDAPIESFPKDCSSFLYGFISNENCTISDPREEYHSIQGYLDKLLQTNTNVIILYEHPDVKEWCAAIQCNNSAAQTAEMNNLKAFFDQHRGIKGIVFMNLLQQSDPPSACPDYNELLKSYIQLMRNTFPKLSIGIHIPARLQIGYYQNPELPWLDFNVLDCVVDFYILALTNINECSNEYLKTSQYPLTEGCNNTVDMVRIFIEESGATSSKIHYRFPVYAETLDPDADFCKTFVPNFCKNSQEAKTTVCADTLQSLYEKGAYTKQYGAGFILSSIDNDDFDCTCQCGMSYPGFNAMLNGYNGGPIPPPCALFDRI